MTINMLLEQSERSPTQDASTVPDYPPSVTQRAELEHEMFQRESDAQSRLLKILFAVALIGTLSDALLSLLLGSQNEGRFPPMTQSNSVACVLLLAALFVFYVKGLVAGKLAYYSAVLLAFAGHAFWVGYGLSTPGLAFVALLMIQEALSPRSVTVLGPLAVSAGLLVALIGAAQVSGLLQPVYVPLEHQLVVVAALFVSAYLLGRVFLNSRHRIWSQQLDASVKLLDSNTRLQTALQARNRFFAAVSHEMRTPLHGISSAISLLNHPRASSEAKVRYMQSIEKSVFDMTRVIDDVLDLSRLESGGFALNRECVGIRPLCEQSIESFKAVADEKNIQLVLEPHFERSPLVWADGLRLRQMLSNLLSNALKFTSAGSVVLDVHASLVEPKRMQCTFSVTDTGCGVDPALLSALFEPFTQGENQKNGDRPGSGLGLSIVAGLARQMGGTVGATSALGQGSRFWFTVVLDEIPST